MKHRLKFLLIIPFLYLQNINAQIEAPWEVHGKLCTDGHYIVYEDGTPFFYLGDTNWEFLTRTRRDDVDKFLKNRSEIGFTVLQAAATGVYLKREPVLRGDSVRRNIYGDRSFIDFDITQPEVTPGNDFNDPLQYDYWDHIDFLVKKAEEYGIYVGILPGWHKLYTEEIITEKNARAYGKWLGERYRNNPNIIWILGGDTRPKTDAAKNTFNEMAKGIKEGDTGFHLITFHPMGGNRSSQWYHNKDWLDFNMHQSGHSERDLPNYKKISIDYGLTPAKPCLDAEPRYEDHSVNWNPDNGWFNDFDVRQAAYWSLFSGACGHTYGTRGVWQMYAPDIEKRGPLNNYWYDAMNLPGGKDMKHVKDLMLSRPFLSRVPDQNLLVENNYSGADYLVATRGDGYAFVYAPTGKDFQVDIKKVTDSENIVAWWYNPRDGKCYNKTGKKEIHKPFIKIKNLTNPVSFNPPGEPGRGNDWVLVLDDATRTWPVPGTKDLTRDIKKKQVDYVFVPKIIGEWWPVAGNPDIGECTSEKQQPVDFGIWQAADGTWQIWSCIRFTNCGEKTRLFHGWEGKNLTDTMWTPLGVTMTADTTLGEVSGGLQAPHVIKKDGVYHMLYGAWYQICLATSTDGKNFERYKNESGTPRLFKGNNEDWINTRDAMTLKIGDKYYCYYTSHREEKDTAKIKAAIFCKTSEDLIHWDEEKMVSGGGRVAELDIWHGGDAECPFVVPVEDKYVLFRNQRYIGGIQINTQYCSADPLNFGIDNDTYEVGQLSVAAPEIIHHNGQYYMAALNTNLDGIRIAKIEFVKVPKCRVKK